MATSGTVSTTTFNTLKVVDQAFLRCRMPSQAVTAEMHDNAKNTLYLLLSEMANYRTPSWCIKKAVLPMTESHAAVTLPVGAVSVLNVNYRSTTEIEATALLEDVMEFSVMFTDAATPLTVELGFAILPDEGVVFQVSDDNAVWTTVGRLVEPALSRQWVDLDSPAAGLYFRVVAETAFEVNTLSVHNTPREIPLGSINRDNYTAFPDKSFTGRPVNYWFQRDTTPKLNLWPSPNTESQDSAQLVVWYHRHIMDVGTLQESLEVPQRWLEAIISQLALRLAEQNPQVDMGVIPILANRAMTALNMAWEGDNDGSSTFYQPNISAYTR